VTITRQPFAEVSALPLLGRELLRLPSFAERTDVGIPDAALLDLPEKVVQFGTGAFLRGFVDYFIDAANRQGMFNGRIVAVASTTDGGGREQLLTEQAGLYTLVIRGIDSGRPVKEVRVVSSVSRALSARDAWHDVLALARSPELRLVVSNTTEIGITLDEGDELDFAPPRSFPGKLTRFLLERARAVDFDARGGVIVLPCELIEANGDRLRETVLALAARWKLEDEFSSWIEAAVRFCNTLVDRIVPGAPPPDDAARLQQALGYRDALITTCEAYSLFAIQGGDALRAQLGFADANPAVIVTDDVAPYSERKVRLLNGIHTIMVPVALLCGCETVQEALEHELVGRFVRRVLLEEILPTVSAPGADAFACDALDRFANPYVRHALFDISLHGTMKLRVRVVPSIRRAAERGQGWEVPQSLAFGFAAYLRFMRGDLHAARHAAGLPVPRDDLGQRVAALWSVGPNDQPAALARLVRAACSDQTTWREDLTTIPNFADAVTAHLTRIVRDGPQSALGALLAEPASV
jgi:tagaturonate reductase